MKFFAQLDSNNVVTNISVADETWVSEGWIEYEDNGRVVIGSRLSNGNWILPQPFPSWTLDDNYDWQPPKPKPEGSGWYWNEDELDWLNVNP